MTAATSPKFQRRKDARPAEIVQAALQVFTEKGFAAARLDDIAARAGVSKGALYLYFATKEELFHAVVAQAVAPNLARVRALVEAYDGPFRDLLLIFMRQMAQAAERSPIGAIGKMVIGESRNFPTLAREWHDSVVAPMLAVLTATIARAQGRGEVRPGEPRLIAMQIAGPFLMAVLWRETFVPVGAMAVDLDRLAEQHARTLREGLFLPAPPPEPGP